MVRKIGIVVIAVLFLGLIGFIFLGGLVKPVISQTQLPVYSIAGKWFSGAATSDSLKQLFSDTRQLHESGKIPGTLAAVYYDTPAAAKGKLNVWVGVLVSDTTMTLPEGYLLRRFPSTVAVRAELKAHYMVAPTPDKVRTQLHAFAAAQKLNPGNYVIERYLNAQEIIMEIPVTKL